MVQLSRLVAYAAGRKSAKPVRNYLKGKFIDTVRLHVKSGGGGMGLPKFGGLGGKGGDIYFVATEGETLTTLLQKYPLREIKSETGCHSRPQKLMGEPGEDKNVEIPLGISVIDEHGRVLGELDTPGSSVLVARGGEGGSEVTDYKGTPGQNHFVRLDMKLIADVGLVGFPNAGKSTLLRALSKAKPKIAAYPFTTVRPEIGMMQYPDLRQISVADLPGLLEGAHVNRGMGSSFLRHIERTRLLLLVADVRGFQLSPQHAYRNCIETVLLLNKELELYKEELMDKPAFLVVNKLDLPGALEIFETVKEQVKNLAAVAENFPEELRPRRALQLEGVVGMCASEGQEAAQKLKVIIRHLLDEFADPLLITANSQN